jgi:hypothetical protein
VSGGHPVAAHRRADSERVASLRQSFFDASVSRLSLNANAARDVVPGRTRLTPSLAHEVRLRADSESAPDRDAATRPEGWLYENLSVAGQYIVPVWSGPHDYMMRVVIDDRVTAVQPASISVKTTLASAADPNAVLRAPNLSIRHESAAQKTSTGTKLQLGYDVTRERREKQREYIDDGEPVMDLISIETKGELVLGRVRTELAFEKGSAPNPKALIQDALSAGGYIRWRRVWIDKNTGERSGIDVVLGMKAEGSGEVGLGAQPGGLGSKADIEATVRFYGPNARSLDTHALTQHASEELAKLLQREPEVRAAVDPNNRGGRDLARFKITQHLYLGTSVWQFAPRPVSGGLNQGHDAVALAIRVNDLLHQTGKLPKEQTIDGHVQARTLLGQLWQRATPHERSSWAQQLHNRLNVNFGLPEVARLNARALAQRPMSYREREYRRLLLRS